jgi:hypothetical protein
MIITVYEVKLCGWEKYIGHVRELLTADETNLWYTGTANVLQKKKKKTNKQNK